MKTTLLALLSLSLFACAAAPTASDSQGTATSNETSTLGDISVNGQTALEMLDQTSTNEMSVATWKLELLPVGLVVHGTTMSIAFALGEKGGKTYVRAIAVGGADAENATMADVRAMMQAVRADIAAAAQNIPELDDPTANVDDSDYAPQTDASATNCNEGLHGILESIIQSGENAKDMGFKVASTPMGIGGFIELGYGAAISGLAHWADTYACPDAH